MSKTYAWGANYYGQLGDNSITNKSVPTSVSMLNWSTMGYPTISCGSALAISEETGLAYAWGWNSYGQLGINSIVDRSTPTSVSSTISWKYIGQAQHTIGINAANGKAYAWGLNNDGQLGINSADIKSVPTSVQSNISWKQISVGGNVSTGIDGATGLAYAWGDNTFGQLGDNSRTNRSIPTLVYRPPIDIGGTSTGSNNTFGGTQTFVDPNNPANFKGTLNTFQIYVYQACTVCKMGTFYGSGGNFTMRDFENIGSVAKGSLQTFTGKSCSVEAGDFIGEYSDNSIFIDTTKTGTTLYSKADDNFTSGQKTYNLLTTNYRIAAAATGVSSTNWREVIAGSAFTFAIDGDTGRAYSWGINNTGTLGIGSLASKSIPTLLPSTISWKQIACGNNSAYGIDGATGLAYAWGSNQYGQLGIGSLASKSVPTSVSSTISWKQIACGNAFTYGIDGATGKAYAWGINSYGELGIGSLASRSVPTSVSSTISWDKIFVGGSFVFGFEGGNPGPAKLKTFAGISVNAISNIVTVPIANIKSINGVQ